MQNRYAKSISACAFILSVVLGGNAHAIDVDPGDYTAAPAGTFLALGYAQWATRNELNVLGVGTLKPGYKLDSAVNIARFVQFVDIGGIIVDPQILLPFGSLYNANLGGVRVPDSNGMADPILAATAWLVNKPDPVYSTYLGVTPYVTIPLGTYHRNNPINLGENRWKGTLQFGLIQGIAPNLLVDLIGDVTFYGSNADANALGQRLTESPSSQLQSWLRYNVNPKLSLAAGYSYTFGGNQYLNGVSNGLRTEFQQIRGSLQYMMAPDWQIQAQIIHDFGVHGGFPQDIGVRLRILKIFAGDTPAQPVVKSKF